MHVVGADDGMPLWYARIGCCTLGRTDHESDETIVAAAPCRDDARMEAQMCARAYERCSNVSHHMYVLQINVCKFLLGSSSFHSKPLELGTILGIKPNVASKGVGFATVYRLPARIQIGHVVSVMTGRPRLFVGALVCNLGLTRPIRYDG
jgi:hypothetical protein